MGQTYSVPLICLLSHSSSTSIEIQNSGFESDVVGHDNTFLYGTNLLQPWERYQTRNILTNSSVGVMNPTGGTLFNDPVYGDSAPEGTQIGYLNVDDTKGEYGIVQTLTGNTVTAGTTYTLSAWIGNPANNTWSTFSTEPSASYDVTQFPGYNVQLLADSNILVEDLRPSSVQWMEEGHWKQSVISITISPGDPHIGQTLAIRIKNGASTGLSHLCCFDGIRLEATTVAPSLSPSMEPTMEPSLSPTAEPTVEPSLSPTTGPTVEPSLSPTTEPTVEPTYNPSESPSEPTGDPSTAPTKAPSTMPTASPSDNPVAGDETTNPGGDDDSDASYITFAANMIIGMCLSLVMV